MQPDHPHAAAADDETAAAGAAAADGVADPGTWLTGIWYHALPARDLRAGAMRRVEMLGDRILLARDADGAPFALRDICPHRGIPLSHGRFDGREVECPYHGWRFDGTGRCTAIPSLVPGQGTDPGRIRTTCFHVKEAAGQIWLWCPDPARPGEEPGPLPPMADIPADLLRHVDTMEFPCALDHAVIGLMDPAHGPYVHRSWWWRTQRSMHEKAKRFAPAELGFAMVRHAPSRNSFAYRLLGGVPETEIVFHLPGLRIERTATARYRYVGMTTVTPIDARRTRVVQSMYWDVPWLTLLRPALAPFVRRFLMQDRDTVARQQEGLAYNPSLMLIDDADTQAKWYFRMKREYARARAEKRAFHNPVRERILRWRS